jgi:dipeptidyl aminopeptidase/acylaminoacyl peptidase
MQSPISRGVRVTSLLMLIASGAFSGQLALAQTAAPAGKPVLTLEDIYSEASVIDAALSPNGKMIAAAIRREDSDMLVVLDLTTGQKTPVTRINKDDFGDQIDVRMGFVLWKTDDRLLFQLRSEANEGVGYDRLSRSNLLRVGNRLYGVDRDGKNLMPMFGKQWNEELVGAFDTSDIASMLRSDPKYILIKVGGWEGRSLFKVDVTTGQGKVVEAQKDGIVDWWFDVNGKAVVREEYSMGTLRFYRRLEDGRWKKFYSVRRSDMDEREEFIVVGPSKDTTKFYVLARPEGRDRMGVYLYDLPNESFGEPVVENSDYDIVAARSSEDGTKLETHCYDVHVRVCDFADSTRNEYMKVLRRHFKESANVYIWDASTDGKFILLQVDGPSDPPAVYYYRVAENKLEFVGLRQGALRDRAMPKAAVIHYKTRDGQQQTGYLTYPPGGENAKSLPLVLMPHGGPMARDRLEYDPWVQYLAARGYAVFQPNFRGSSGYGLKYEESGYRERGRKMQDDLTDAVKWLADLGTIDPARVCIVGASYGGYAALAGAAFTPDTYKCAVSIAGIGDYEDLIRWKKRKYGQEVFDFYVKSVGDPDKELASIHAISPAYHIDAIKIPILLAHGDKDEIVPYSQSESFQKLMNKSGRKTELIRLPDEGHGDYSRNASKVLWSTVATFLWDNIGKGYGVVDPPPKYVFKK